MSEKSRLIKNTGLIAMGNFGAKMISFLLLPLYTSILTTSEYGTYDFIVAISAFLLPIVTMSMHEAMFRFIIDTGNKSDRFKTVVTNAFVMVMLGIAIMAVVMFGIEVYLKTGLMIYICVYVFANALYVFANNMLRGLGKIKEFAIVTSSKNIMQLLFNVIAIAVLHWGMEGLLFSLCLSELIAFFVVATVSKMWSQIKCRYVSSKCIREMLVYSVPLIPNTLCSQIINISDRFIISGFMGSAANGIYAISYKFPAVIDTFYHFFYTAWSESASRVFSKGKEEAEKYYQSLHEMIDNMLFAVILLMISVMPIMFRIFVRGDYIEGFDYVPYLMLAMYFASMAKFYSGIFTALKKTKAMATSTIIAAIVNVIVNLALIDAIGLYAAAISTLIADVVLVEIRRKFLQKDVPFKTDCKKTVVRIIMIVYVMCLYSYNNWTKIVVSIVGVSIYSFFDNKEAISTLAKKIIKKKM